jgi:hypothetical protein
MPYLKKTMLQQIESLYNRSIKHLLNLHISRMDVVGQFTGLSPYAIMPFRGRCAFRLGVLAYNVLNGRQLKAILNSLMFSSNSRYALRDCPSRHIVIPPHDRLKNSNLNLLMFIANFVNKGIRHNFKLNFVDYKHFPLNNLLQLSDIL